MEAGDKMRRSKDYRYYRHKQSECPNTHTFRRDELELIVMAWIQNWIDDPDTDWDYILKTASGDDAYLTEQIAEVQARIDELDPERKRLIRLAAKAGITDDELADELERIENDRRLLTADAEDLEAKLSSEVFLDVEGYEWPTPTKAELDNHWTFEEWLASIREHDIEIEVDKDGGLWGSFAASPDVYSLVEIQSDLIPLGDTNSDPEPEAEQDRLSASDSLHLLCAYDRFNALLLT